MSFLSCRRQRQPGKPSLGVSNELALRGLRAEADVVLLLNVFLDVSLHVRITPSQGRHRCEFPILHTKARPLLTFSSGQLCALPTLLRGQKRSSAGRLSASICAIALISSIEKSFFFLTVINFAALSQPIPFCRFHLLPRWVVTEEGRAEQK